jgi:hypothetical protein
VRVYLKARGRPKLNIMSPPLRLGMRPRQAVRVHGDHLKKTHHARHGLLVADLGDMMFSIGPTGHPKLASSVEPMLNFVSPSVCGAGDLRGQDSRRV